MDNIKSSFFKHILFHHLNIKRKLRIIKYNKSLHHLLNIKLIEYKILSGKYIIFGKNGKGKEYYRKNYMNDKLMYEGEFKNGKRNGRGKEYFITGIIEGDIINYNSEIDDLLIFEGEFLNGERNGKGKEYYADGKIKFEGEYLNGERNGNGKKYYTNTQLEFEGEYKNGEKWDGKGYDINGNIVFELKQGNGFIQNEGEYKNGKKNGKVKDYYFEGEYLN